MKGKNIEHQQRLKTGCWDGGRTHDDTWVSSSSEHGAVMPLTEKTQRGLKKVDNELDIKYGKLEITDLKTLVF